MTIQTQTAFKLTWLSLAMALAGCGGGGGDEAPANASASTVEAAAADSADATANADGADTSDTTFDAKISAASTTTWRQVVDEGASFVVPANSRMRFGRADIGWVEKTVSGAGVCTNDFFGFDKTKPGYRSCYIAVTAAPAPAPAPAPVPAPAPAPAPTGNPADVSAAGVITTPYPTLQSISVEWAFTGDANANAVVNVRYRAQGQSAWSSAMPLRRVKAGSTSGFSWKTRHSGSVVNLTPGTTYELELALRDPDGGSVTRNATVTTRAVPVPMANAPIKVATPSTLKNVLAAAQPGDIVQLGSGTYSGFSIERDGAAGKPLVIRGTAGSVINGEVYMYARKHVSLESLNVNGRIRFNASNNVSITRSTIKASASVGGGEGIVTYLRSENAYIADNVVTGTTRWAEASLGVNGANLGEGILVTGPGHVIMNNRVSGFRDNISLLEADEAVDQFSIDILNNDLSVAADDAIEADFCFHNCRIMNNRITNAFVGISSQPSLGGPTYMVRNSLYNIAFNAFKLNNASYGNVLLHNTVVKGGDSLGIYSGAVIADLYSRNNLFIGGPGGTFGGYSNGSGKVLSISDLQVSTANMNNDAFGSTVGSFDGLFGGTRFSGLAQLRSATTEKNAVQVDLSVFAASVGMPSSAMTTYSVPDLRLRSGSAAENVGVAIPNINDGFAGSAPDAGAYEAGSALRVVGPR